MLIIQILMMILAPFMIASCSDKDQIETPVEPVKNAEYNEYYDSRGILHFELRGPVVLCVGRVGISRPACRWVRQ